MRLTVSGSFTLMIDRERTMALWLSCERLVRRRSRAPSGQPLGHHVSVCQKTRGGTRRSALFSWTLLGADVI